VYPLLLKEVDRTSRLENQAPPMPAGLVVGDPHEDERRSGGDEALVEGAAGSDESDDKGKRQERDRTAPSVSVRKR
jgi:hypothetical protein